MASFLKKLSDMKPKGSLKFLLHQHLSAYDPARSMKVIHASNLTKSEGFCPRLYALADEEGYKAKDSWLTTSERMTYQIGRDQEHNIVQWFGEMGKAFCHWKCVACSKLHEFQLKPLKCSQCGCRKLDPKEVRYTSAITGASCGVDMLASLTPEALTLVEIKTMDKEDFKALKAPLAEHRWRTNLYLRIVAESNQPSANLINTDSARILYISKGGYGCMDPEPATWGLSDKFSPFKEFLILRKDDDTDEIAWRAQTVTEFRAAKVGMPTGICTTAMSKRAAKCPLRGQCFSGDFPPVYDWQAAFKEKKGA